MSVTTSLQDVSKPLPIPPYGRPAVHPFEHLKETLPFPMYEITRPLTGNHLFDLGIDPKAIEALPDQELFQFMFRHPASSAMWMQFLSPTRISTLLQKEFVGAFSWSEHPPEEILRRRLACVLLRERYSRHPFYAARAAKEGESYWTEFQQGCYNV